MLACNDDHALPGQAVRRQRRHDAAVEKLEASVVLVTPELRERDSTEEESRQAHEEEGAGVWRTPSGAKKGAC